MSTAFSGGATATAKQVGETAGKEIAKGVAQGFAQGSGADFTAPMDRAIESVTR